MLKSITCILMLGAIMLLNIETGSAQGPTVGLFLNTANAAPGYTLFAPMPFTSTYLIDNEGLLVHEWLGTTRPAMAVYLKENGNLLRTEKIIPPEYDGGGTGGRLLEQDWDGNLVWDYVLGSKDRGPHHDIEPLPNGNVLVLAWERKTADEMIAMGRQPDLALVNEYWPEHIIEIQRTGLREGIVVWEWHAWDHLIQDYDSTKPDYGVIAQRPERIDVNFPDDTRAARNKDWMHGNSIDYNAELDQILLSIHNLNEIWIVDHSTTTQEAAGSTGGRSGKGGDLLYRWGNPIAYDAGGVDDRKLFLQHDARWIEKGKPGAGNILLFNNGQKRPVTEFSSIEEIAPPVDSNGVYSRPSGQAFGPADPVWIYTAPVLTDFYATNISGAERQENGNTLVCDGPHGTFFEVASDGEVVWRYINPVTRNGPVPQGTVVAIGAGSWENQTFRASRYAPDYPAFTGRVLTAGDPIELDPVSIKDIPSPQTGYTLEPNYPNPFSHATTISMHLSEALSIRLSIHDMLGREISVLHQGTASAGHFSIPFDAQGLPAGTYVIRLLAGGELTTRTMLILD